MQSKRMTNNQAIAEHIVTCTEILRFHQKSLVTEHELFIVNDKLSYKQEYYRTIAKYIDNEEYQTEFTDDVQKDNFHEQFVYTKEWKFTKR